MKIFLALVALFILPGSAYAFWQGILFIGHDPVLLRFILIGIGSGFLIYYIFLRKWNYFLTFEHELTHAVMSLMFLRRVRRFVVTKNDGGVVYHSGGFGGEFGDIMIKMAPYFFPTFSFIAILFQPLVPNKFFPWFLVFIGFTLMFHHLSTVKETIQNWTSDSFQEAGSGQTRNTDIATMGFVFTFIFIIPMTLFFDSLVLWFVKYGYHGGILLIKAVFHGSTLFFKILILKIQTFIH